MCEHIHAVSIPICPMIQSTYFIQSALRHKMNRHHICCKLIIIIPDKTK